MLEVKDLSLRAGHFLLKEINLSVEKGSCHVLIGPTGSGKSLLLETVLGLRRPLKGKIFLEERDITFEPVEKRGLSYLPQDLALFPHLTVRENIYYGLEIRKVKDQELYKLTQELISALKIEPLLERKVQGLSGGERQRIALIRALATGNRYLLLDEPFSALHEGLKKELWHLLKDLQKTYNLTLLMVSHDLEEAFFLADTISVIIQGKIHQRGPKLEVYRRPKTLDVASFFGIKNIFEGEIIGLNDKKVQVRVPDLNTILIVPQEAFSSESLENEGFKVFLGIRSEDILIVRRDLGRGREENVLSARVVEIYPKGKLFTLFVVPQNTKTLLEIEVPALSFQKLKAFPGKEIEVILPGERLFILPGLHNTPLKQVKASSPLQRWEEPPSL